MILLLPGVRIRPFPQASEVASNTALIALPHAFTFLTEYS